MSKPGSIRAAAPRLGSQGALDDRFARAAEAAGFAIGPEGSDGLLLLVGCAGWDGGLAVLAGLRQDQRTRAVLCCAAPPPPGLGARVRSIGALSWWGPTAPAWLIGLAVEAVTREPAAGAARAPVAPEGALRALPAIARRLMGLQHAALYERRADEWRAVGCDPTMGGAGVVPVDLLPFVDENDQLVVIPDALHALRFDEADPWRCLIALPVAPQLVLLLADAQPQLPHPAALLRLEALRDTAALAIAWQREREQLIDTLVAGLQLSGEGAEAADEEQALIERVLRGRAPRGRQVALRATANSGAPGRWWQQSAGGTRALSPAAPELRAELDALLAEGRPDGVDPATVLVRHEGGPWIDLVVKLEAGERGRSVRAALEAVASELSLALRIRRRSADQAAIAAIATLLASGGDPGALLGGVADRVADRLKADGVKIIVASEARGRRVLQQLFRTGAEAARRRAVTLSAAEGLADWVVLHEDWLSLQHPPMGAAGEPGLAVGQSGRHGAVRLRPRPVSHLWGAGPTDAERAQLLVPFCDENGVVVGVLGVWREHDAPFHAELDLSSLRALAPHVSAAVARHIERERAGVELGALQALGPDLERARGFGEAAGLVLDQLLRLSGARKALLLLEEPQRPELATVVAVAQVGPAGGPPGVAGRAGPDDQGSVRWGAAREGREAALVAHLSAGEAIGQDGVLSQLQLFVPLSLGALGGAVALLRAERAGEEPTLRQQPGELVGVPLIARAATERAVRAFAGPAMAMLQRHLRRREVSLVDRVAAATARPLEVALKELKASLDADVAFLAVKHGGGLRIEHSLGPVALDGHQVDLPGGQRAPLRSADLLGEESHRLRAFDLRLLAHIEAETGRPARSWLSLPLRSAGHLLGGLHLLRLDGSGAFGPEGEQLAEAVVAAAVERSLALDWIGLQDDLEALTRELAGASADTLARALPERLEVWLRAALHRAVSVVIVAREGSRALFSCASAVVSPADRAALAERSAAAPGVELREARPSRGPRASGPRAAWLASPIQLSSDPELSGHLFVLHTQALDVDDARRCREASRALSVLLEGEAIRARWKLQAGLFRHAMLGPAQGLQSAARKLALLSRQTAPAEVEIAEAEQRVLVECNALRTWQSNQRILVSVQSGQPPDLRLREGALRPLIERCIRRYDAAFAERGAAVTLRWAADGALRFAFDEAAVDVMFTNLLDNASKYGFFNRQVAVGVAVEGPEVVISVESFGLAIPSGAHEALYHPGSRLAARDPMRAIHGEGLGLFLVGLLVDAAGGSISHSCAPEGLDRGPSSPHRVCFRLCLPHRWGRAAPRGEPQRRGR